MTPLNRGKMNQPENKGPLARFQILAPAKWMTEEQQPVYDFQNRCKMNQPENKSLLASF